MGNGLYKLIFYILNGFVGVGYDVMLDLVDVWEIFVFLVILIRFYIVINNLRYFREKVMFFYFVKCVLNFIMSCKW